MLKKFKCTGRKWLRFVIILFVLRKVLMTIDIYYRLVYRNIS